MRILTTTEVAERLGVTRQTVWQWVQDGRLTPTLRSPTSGAMFFDARTITDLAGDTDRRAS